MTGRQSKPPVKTLVSAGGVVYQYVDGQLQTVLCGHCIPGKTGNHRTEVQGSDRPDSQEKIRWSLAKGTPDQGETLEETALREVREETGLEVKLESPIGSIDYWFADRDGEARYHKTVHFYLMAPVGGHPDHHDPEFDVVQWFPFDEAIEALTYPNEVGVLRQAAQLINQQKGGR